MIGVKIIKFLLLRISLVLKGFLVGGLIHSVGPKFESSSA
jgi:hypothetical protein